MDERVKKLEELFKDPELVEKIFTGDPDQMLANLAAQGIEMTGDELKDLSAGILSRVRELEEGELSEEDLVNVAGGKKTKKINRGFLKGMEDAAEDHFSGTCKGAKKSGFFYALGYTTGYLIYNYL